MPETAEGTDRPVATNATVAGLLDVLDLRDDGPDRFLGASVPMNLTHLFGGQVLAQGLIAAARTVDTSKAAHSLHAYFLRAGDPYQPIEFTVERVRDGRRLSCRSVTARQSGKAIATIVMSFADTSGAIVHQIDAPTCPRPEELPTLSEAAESWGGLGPSWGGFEAIDVRVRPNEVDRSAGGVALAADSADFIWQRVAEPIPDDRVLHQALMVYMSDMMLLAAALVPHGVPLGHEDLDGGQWDGVSLDHTIWFHRPASADQWLLFAQTSPFAASGRSLSTAEVFDLDGRLVASTAQEGLIFDTEPG